MWPFRKQTEKTFKATALGYEQFGIITVRWFWNLYEDRSGNRYASKFHGGEVKANRKSDYSMPAQIDAWLHGGPLPNRLCDTLEGFTMGCEQ